MPDEQARKRYCDIRATSLEEVRQTCLRHIKNITATAIDLVDNDDYTELDVFYIHMFSETWKDLLEDVEKMIGEK